MTEINHTIIASGSSGNCVVIENIIFDIGVAYKRIKEHLYNTKYIIITHTHSDHVKESTFKRIRKDFPRIKFIGNYEVNHKFEMDVVSLENVPVVLDDLTLIPFDCPHDVLNYGYAFEMKGLNVIYATDTVTLEKAPKRPYDYLFIESNHDERKLQEVQSTNKNGYRPFLGAKRHFSTQEAKLFYYLNRRGPESKLIELHKSERFY